MKIEVMMLRESSIPLDERFARLRELLATEERFRVSWDYFHDEMATCSDFMKLGRVEENIFVNQAIGAALKKFGVLAGPKAMTTRHIPEYRFWHGIRHYGSKTGVFFFDENSGQGLMGLIKELRNNMVDLIRFTTFATPSGTAYPMRTAPGGKPQ